MVEVLPLPQVARRNVAQLVVFSQNHFLFDSLTMNRLIVLRKGKKSVILIIDKLTLATHSYARHFHLEDKIL